MIHLVPHGWRNTLYPGARWLLPYQPCRAKSQLSSIKSGLRQTDSFSKRSGGPGRGYLASRSNDVTRGPPERRRSSDRPVSRAVSRSDSAFPASPRRESRSNPFLDKEAVRDSPSRGGRTGGERRSGSNLNSKPDRGHRGRDSQAGEGRKFDSDLSTLSTRVEKDFRSREDRPSTARKFDGNFDTKLDRGNRSRDSQTGQERRLTSDPSAQVNRDYQGRDGLAGRGSGSGSDLKHRTGRDHRDEDGQSGRRRRTDSDRKPRAGRDHRGHDNQPAQTFTVRKSNWNPAEDGDAEGRGRSRREDSLNRNSQFDDKRTFGRAQDAQSYPRVESFTAKHVAGEGLEEPSQLQSHFLQLNSTIEGYERSFQDALPRIMNVGSNKPQNAEEILDFKERQRQIWHEVFKKLPGRLGQLSRQWKDAVKDMNRFLLSSEVLSERRERWVIVGKNKYRSYIDMQNPIKSHDRGQLINDRVQKAVDALDAQAIGRRSARETTMQELESTSIEESGRAITPARENVTEPSDLGFRTPAVSHQSRRDTAPYSEVSQSFRKSDRGEKTNAYNNDRDEYDYTTVPYTTAGSEFIYGANPVIAALKSQRRRLYKVYLHERVLADDAQKSEILQLAKSAKVTFKIVDNSFLSVIDKMTGGRPHNGVVLEASPLPLPPVASLGRLNETSDTVPLTLEAQSAEDAITNAPAASLPIQQRTSDGWRYPLIVLLDGILDPGNLGNILRTCHFYDVDAVAICTNTCAPVSSPVVVKASSGASEAIRLFGIGKPANFVRECAINKWTVYGAVAPEGGVPSSKAAERQLSTTRMTSPLFNGPAILMLGSEGEGLRKNLREKARFDVFIEGTTRPGKLSVGVDSLNVGAAAAVLLEAFMRRPKGKAPELAA